MMPTEEAIQFTPFGPWHLVNGKDQTLCGKNALRATKMWETWSDKSYRCPLCERRA